MISTNNYKSLLEAGLASQSIKLSDVQIDQLLVYIDLLEKWNKVYNLTSIHDKEQMIILHLLDSLSILNDVIKYLEQGKKSEQYDGNIKVADIGTGGGLPGIPLAICLPDINFTLIDARDKKIRFLHQVVNQLKLKNVKPIHTRVEDYQVEESFNLIITRAFSSLKDMLGICSHLCHTSGLFLAMKGKEPELEIKEIPEEFELVNIKVLNVYQLDASRHLLVIEQK
jgi:16S rRNA (guanine527-N7)-methyltransferase